MSIYSIFPGHCTNQPTPGLFVANNTNQYCRLLFVHTVTMDTTQIQGVRVGLSKGLVDEVGTSWGADMKGSLVRVWVGG